MFPVIDTAAGLAFVYLLLSVVVSALRESGEALMMRRSKSLRDGLHRLLGGETAGRLYEHPLVAVLADHPFGPSYIPPRTFSAALLDLIRTGGVPDGLRDAFRVFEAAADGDGARLEAGIESWFDSAMDAVSRGYKRHTRVWLAALGLAVTVTVNADSIRMLGALLNDPALRTKTAEAARQVAGAPLPDRTRAVEELKALGVPIGWPGATLDNTLPWKPAWSGAWWRNALLLLEWHWAGWLITVAAIGMGAPFWFDLLNRFPARST